MGITDVDCESRGGHCGPKSLGLGCRWGRAGTRSDGGAGAGKVERALSLRAPPFQASC